MSLMGTARRALGVTLRRYGYELIESDALFDWQKPVLSPQALAEPNIPSGARDYLRRDNHKLRDLTDRYDEFDEEATTPLVWTDSAIRDEDILFFRGETAYVWQLRGQNMNPLSYLLAAFYLRSIDTHGLFSKLEEDGLFGCFTIEAGGQVVSRDLLDSIAEIYFLDKHLGITSVEGLRVLDIGAGYGRLAHRLVTACPNLARYTCTDAVAVSSFISDFYLGFRGLGERAQAVALDEIEQALNEQGADLAINIHSFSECQISAIQWWVSLLARARVKHLMVVPNAVNGDGSALLTNDGKDFGDILEAQGYRLVAKEPKYRFPEVQEYGINPTHHYLFELV